MPIHLDIKGMHAKIAHMESKHEKAIATIRSEITKSAARERRLGWLMAKIEENAANSVTWASFLAEFGAQAGKSAKRNGKAAINPIACWTASERTLRTEFALVGGMFGRLKYGRIDFDNFLYHVRQRFVNLELKQEIAKCVFDELFPFVTLACSPGSTVQACVRFAVEKGTPMNLFTNSLSITEIAPKSGVEIHLSGGKVLPDAHGLAGEPAREFFEKSVVRVALLGASSIECLQNDAVLYVQNAEECSILNQMIATATEKVIIVCDATKLGIAAPWRVARLSELPNQNIKDRPLALREVVFVTNDPDSDQVRQSLAAIHGKEEKIVERINIAREVIAHLRQLEKGTSKSRIRLVLTKQNET